MLVKMQPVKLTVVLFLSFFATLVTANYWERRVSLINSERNIKVGSSRKLDTKEQAANEVLMGYKLKEYDYGFQNPGEFLPYLHFFQSKPQVEQSEVFKIIKKLPKGASLHSHDTALVSSDFLFNLTYRDNLYGCRNDDVFSLRFFKNSSVGTQCNWKPLSEWRASSANFDDFLRSRLTLVVDNPDQAYPDANSVWTAFMNIVNTVEGYLGYKDVWEEYFYQVLKELYDDNVMYLEFRGEIPEMYDLEGKTYGKSEVVGIYRDVAKKFMKDYPDFQGVRFIYSPRRNSNVSAVDEYVKLTLELSQLYPSFLAGFDLEGQEDLGHPLIDFIPQLTTLKEDGTKFFFHAGETNWYGTSTDLNLFDAVLMNSTRIGHGYALLKHPALYDIIKNQKIALEITPISDQVLKLVKDLRNHPGSVMFANDFPIVIANNHPSFWGSNGLSYDWYMAFMGMASRNDDLKFLKQLAINSIEFSAMENEEKAIALSKWESDWDDFLDSIVSKKRVLSR